MRETSDTAFAVPRVRRGFWLLLAGALLLSLAFPLARFWSEAISYLDVQVSLVPATPHLGEPVHLVVSLPHSSDRAAVHGPWARLVANWDMTQMRMGQRSATLSGPSATTQDAPTFVVPLTLDMAGQWVANVALTAPGRPQWQSSLHFTLLPSSSAANQRSGP